MGANVTSTVITVLGINIAAPISITNGQYSIAGGAFTSAAGTVTNGQTVTVKLTSSTTPSTITQALLTVGGVAGAFSVTTALADTTPDAFSFTVVTGAALSSSVTSNSITVSGINTAAPISVINGQYSIDGGDFTSAAGTVVNGQDVTVKVAASATLSTTTQAVLTVGGVAGALSITTVSPDATPDAFSFTTVTTGSLNTAITSNLVTVSGINTAAPISITNGQYSIAGGAFTSAAGTVSNGQTVTVRATSAASINITTQAALTIGGVAGTFSLTTALPDTIPDAFSFNAVITASLNTTVTSNLVTISGINTAAPISITNGQYSIAGGAFTSAAGTVSSGQTVTVKSTSAAGINTTMQATLTVGGVVGKFSIITTLQNTSPYAMGGAIQGASLNIATVVSTFAGTAPIADGIGAAAKFHYPSSIVRDQTNLYVADSLNHTVRKIVIATGGVTTLAGTAGVSGSADGTGAAARFNYPQGITTDGSNLYVADRGNHTIRKIVIATGAVTTLAGLVESYSSVDGAGAAASFYSPSGIITDGTNLYVTDNDIIRKIVIATGTVTTLAGTAGVQGSADGRGAAASFYGPSSIITDGINLYVADTDNNTIRKIVIATGAVTTLAGIPGLRGSADGIGAAARFYRPEDVSTDGTNLYVVDTYNHTIRKIVIATSAVTTLAGSVENYGSADGTGTAARFAFPSGITTDGTNLYVADTYNHTIRKIVISTNAVTTLAGTANVSSDGIGAVASFNNPYDICTDGANLYVADRDNSIIRKIVIATGAVTTLAGTAGVSGSADGTGAAARFNFPLGITTDGTNLYVTDTYNNTIRKIVIATGAVTTLAGSVGNYGSADGTGATASFDYPSSITTDGTNLYVADTYNNTIRKIVIATGAVTTLAGMAGVSGSADGVGAAARFYNPYGITTDGFDLFVADSTNGTIRKIH